MSRNINELVNKIFNHRYLVNVSKEVLSFLNQCPTVTDIGDIPVEETVYSNWGDYSCVAGIQRTEVHSNPQALMALLHDTYKRDIGFEIPHITPNYNIEDAHLSINQMTEIMLEMGTFTILRREDIVDVFNTIVDYLMTLDEMKITSPNYVPPPEEDIAILTELMNALRPGANSFDSKPVRVGLASKLLSKSFKYKRPTNEHLESLNDWMVSGRGPNNDY